MLATLLPDSPLVADQLERASGLVVNVILLSRLSQSEAPCQDTFYSFPILDNSIVFS